ncbi:MAG: diacylglycerol kinase [Gammaproteobacteria bacterium]|nr:MAG: diacylglycerol kinase [Gammaproteobacteria bacterium]
MSSGKNDVPMSAAVFKERTGIGRIIAATGYSMAGLSAAYRGEAAFRQIVWLNLLLIPVALWITPDRIERVLLIGVVFLGLIIELLNSAIEAAVDRISMDIHPLSKRAKDMGSAAQLLGLTLVAIVWSLVLL